MTEREKMVAGDFYDPMDLELTQIRNHAHKCIREFNLHDDPGKANENILKSLFGHVAGNMFIEPPFYCDYGFNIQIGDGFYANFDCILLDVAPIIIGKNCMFAPRVGLYTATHPINSNERTSGIEYGKPIVIGDNVWLCANVIVNPGVTIGNNVVVGSGAVVTKDIPDNVLVAGNPAKIVKTLD